MPPAAAARHQRSIRASRTCWSPQRYGHRSSRMANLPTTVRSQQQTGIGSTLNPVITWYLDVLLGGPVPCVIVAADVLPPDPFAEDPHDPTWTLGEPAQAGLPLTEGERAELLNDLTDLAVYQALLEDRGVRGIVVDCAGCQEQHYHDWTLLRTSLEQLLHGGHVLT